MAVRVDTVSASGGSRSNQGRRYIRGATVTGCAGTGTEKINDAFTQLESAGHVPGAAHPSRASCVLKEINVSAIKGDTVECQIVYEDVTYGSLRRPEASYNTLMGRASLRQINTTKDASNNDIMLTYTYPTSYRAPDGTKPFSTAEYADVGTRSFSKFAIVPKLVPEMTLSVTQIESSNPKTKAKDAIGKVNNGSFALDTSATEGQYLCADIQWSSNDGGATYEVTYTFHYIEEGWNSQEVVWMDPLWGAPGENLDSASRKTPAIYATANFSTLGLTVI
jgi:hypothetical protein